LEPVVTMVPVALLPFAIGVSIFVTGLRCVRPSVEACSAAWNRARRIAAARAAAAAAAAAAAFAAIAAWHALSQVSYPYPPPPPPPLQVEVPDPDEPLEEELPELPQSP
jgi:hypothetical protein